MLRVYTPLFLEPLYLEHNLDFCYGSGNLGTLYPPRIPIDKNKPPSEHPFDIKLLKEVEGFVDTLGGHLASICRTHFYGANIKVVLPNHGANQGRRNVNGRFKDSCYCTINVELKFAVPDVLVDRKLLTAAIKAIHEKHLSLIDERRKEAGSGGLTKKHRGHPAVSL